MEPQDLRNGPPPGLLERVRDAIRLRHYSYRTETQRLLAHLEGTKWIMASLLYGAGGYRGGSTDASRAIMRQPSQLTTCVGKNRPVSTRASQDNVMVKSIARCRW